MIPFVLALGQTWMLDLLLDQSCVKHSFVSFAHGSNCNMWPGMWTMILDIIDFKDGSHAWIVLQGLMRMSNAK